ncbi:MAG: ComEC/Rec2 family competence protein [Planctomycetes bacterium]|nr:ComEC/Rec2 family competence protein [Planctomycetota bacterium]
MDEIRRKLEFIDAQLAGGNDFHKHISGTAPLLFCAVGLVAGVLLQNIFSLPVLFWLVLLTVCAAATVALFVFWGSSSRLYVIAYLTLICFMCLGAVRLVSFEQPRGNDIRNIVGDERRLATIRGLIVTEPYINRNEGWDFARFVPTDPKSSFYLKLGEVKSVDGWAKVAGTVRVQVGEPVLDLKAGDYVQAYCWLSRFGGASNPGQFDISKYLSRRGVYVGVSVQSRDGIEVVGDESRGGFTKIKRNVREVVSQGLLGGMLLEESSQGLLEALLLGYRGNIDSDTYRAFRETGLLHFISLSGMHLGILVGIVWWLCKVAGLGKPLRAAVCIIAICVFLMVVPARAPTLRAAIILLLIRPTGLFEAGWQLSFASVLGIILFSERIAFLIREKIPNAIRPVQFVIELFSVGLAAWLGSAGVLLYHFYRVNPLASVWTVIIFPVVALILTVGFFKVIFSLLLPSAAMILGVVVAWLADILIWAVKLIASWDISEILVGKVSGLVIVWYYSVIMLGIIFYFQRPLVRVKKAICAAMILGLVIFLGVSRWQKLHQDSLIVTCLDVGHGQAILAQLPGGGNVLFDAGSLHSKDIGRRVVCSFLDYRGISRVGHIIMSHNDVDHINGIPEVVENCKVGGIYANDAFFTKADKWGVAKFFAKQLGEKGFEIQPLERDLNLGDGVHMRMLWPSGRVKDEVDLSDNDQSSVWLIEFAGRKMLLCSDIEKFAQGELLREDSGLEADIVVVPHHGSVKTLDRGFLDSISAEVLIYSCGRRGYERQEGIERGAGAKRFYTAKDGAITVRINRNGDIETAAFTE